jgi:DNA-binding response OmpR family regulator
MARILIVEDEERIASFIAKGLAAEGHSVVRLADGESGLDHALSGQFDVVILDIGLPRMSGFELLEQMRAQGSLVPVIVLTARDSVTDTVSALEGGADDYMSKPFRFAELLARVRLRLRQAREQPGVDKDLLEAGGLRLDLRTRQVSCYGADVELSAREFRLLEMFMRNAGQVLSREQLLDHVWGYDFDPVSNVVDVYVGYLRRKVGTSTISTVRGVGYRLEVSHLSPVSAPVTDVP